MRQCEQLANDFRKGRTGQFTEWELYIQGEKLALGLANITSYPTDRERIVLEVDRLRRILSMFAPIGSSSREQTK